MDVKFLYFGNLFEQSPQYRSGLFHGLALHPKSDRDIHHDARLPLPFADGSILGFQSQDVFEHIEYEKVPKILDEVFRCLKPGGLFRLSLPDYNSPLLRRRSVYDAEGNILCDLAMGGRVKARLNGPVEVEFLPGGDAHLWFPTYTSVMELILLSEIRKASKIIFHHAWISRTHYICRSFEQGYMPVSRIPPFDMRADGKPISIVVDFIK